jgi:hypothetical protein
MTPFGYRVLGFGSGGVAPFAASGGTETAYGSYQVHTFTSSGTFTVTGGETKAMDILVIGGGGGGGGIYTSGGGGAGGFVETGASYPEISAGSYTITVGDGGAGSDAAGSARGTNGDDSYFGEGDATYELQAIGGGGGGRYRNNTEGVGVAGGSGGGGAFVNSFLNGLAGGASTQTLYADSYALEYGNAGGDGHGSWVPNDDWMGGSGGGADAAGTNAGSCVKSAAGSGRMNDFRTGANERRAGGGGGGGSGPNCDGTGAAGGAGGGGTGGANDGTDGTAGGTNTGGGGGGAGQHANSEGGNGAAGIVVIRYLV